jgi:hypothetical protein
MIYDASHLTNLMLRIILFITSNKVEPYTESNGFHLLEYKFKKNIKHL